MALNIIKIELINCKYLETVGKHKLFVKLLKYGYNLNWYFVMFDNINMYIDVNKKKESLNSLYGNLCNIKIQI